MREITSAENLIAHVEGDIGEVDDVLRITEIRLLYKLKIPAGKRETLDRVLGSYAEKCPAYQSIKESIPCTWTVDVTEE